jgi:hypothetical protein
VSRLLDHFPYIHAPFEYALRFAPLPHCVFALNSDPNIVAAVKLTPTREPVGIGVAF